jgi:TonB-linked SusC/RagA family outer membrane protein
MSLPGRKIVRLLVAAAALLGLAAPPLHAQSTGTVRGTVVETGTRAPLAGARITAGANLSAVTNEAGEYTLAAVPAGRVQLRATMLGHEAALGSVTVAAGETARQDFALSASALALDAIVVTGTAGAVSRRTVGNAITKVDAAQMTRQTNVTTVTELLQARTPGVQILSNSGVPGSAAEIRIRGASSLTGNDPVIFVDGVRFSTESLGNFTPSGAGVTNFTGQRTSAFDFINPEDIESIEVIKGPAAATLYGAEAAGGVIQIITKKGARGEQQKVQWGLKLEQGRNEWGTEIPFNYTTCNAARIAERSGGEPVWPGCQGVPEGTVLTGRPLLDDPLALRDGGVRRVSLSARGGGDRYSFYFGADRNDEEGVFRNSYNERNSLRANFNVTASDRINVQVTTSYAQGDLRLPVGDESAQGMLLSAFRGRPGRVTTDPLNVGWATTRPEQANSYNNTTRTDRLTLGSTLNLDPVRWFRNRLTLGLDYTSSLAQVLSPAGSTDAEYAGGEARQGLVAQRTPRNFVYTLDYAGNMEADVTGDLQATTSFGMQAISKRYQTLFAQGTGFGAPDVTLIGNATTTLGSNSYSENKSLGFFVQEQLGWRNRLFLTAAVRADDNSSFGTAFNWIYYPKASLSWILSEEPMLEGLFGAARVTSFKLRSAYGHAGKAPDPFAADQTYTVDRAILAPGSVIPVLRARSLGNQNLVAERGEELEVGFDAGFFDDRATVEFTYYDKRMNDVIISAGAPGSTGFGTTFYGGTLNVLQNLGETRNSGVELGIAATPVSLRALTWDTRVSLTTNRNRLVSFGDARTFEPVSGQSYANVQQHRAGYPLGGYWIRVPRRNDDGSPVLSPAGAVVLEDTVSYVGSPSPNREVSFSNTLTLFGSFRLYGLLDYKSGHHLFNYKEFARCTVASQLNCERINDPANASHPDRPLWNTQFAYLERADFVKLRDLSLTYIVPRNLSRHFRSDDASLTLAGHNLALWTDYTGLDPEVNGYGGATAAGVRTFARADVYPVPMLRRVSLSLNLSF